MAKMPEKIDHSVIVIKAMEIVMGQDPLLITPQSLTNVRDIVRAYFKDSGGDVPYPVLNIAKKLMDIILKDAEKDQEYRQLFFQFADQPFQLIKILIKRDPDRFFDFFLIAWNLPAILGKYLHDAKADDEISDDEGQESHENQADGDAAKTTSDMPADKPSDDMESGHVVMPANIIERIRENIRFLDENDIFELLIPVFKQLSGRDAESGEFKDGFQRGYEMILRLTDGVGDEETLTKITRVFERFDTLIEMKFGRFHDSIKSSRKNFPYITVRSAIKEMEKMEGDAHAGGRRFAHFATRTGKTSLALLEPEYLNKKHSLYICPPDTIPTILREYKAYGGDESQLKVLRNADDLNALIQENGNIRYCVISSELLIKRDIQQKEEPADLNGKDTDEEGLAGEIERGSDEDKSNGEDTISDIEELKNAVNPLVLELFHEWKPDYVAVDEVRHFTGYHCELNTSSSKRSRALLYLLNNQDALKRKTTVRLLDATPSDLPRHFYPLISMLHPYEYPIPSKVRDDVGTKPYSLMALFGSKADHATQEQVYNPPTIKSETLSVPMGHAQRVIYDFAAKYSAKNALYRVTIARLATFSPAVLRRLFEKLVKKMAKPTFIKHFNAVYDEWKARNKGTANLPFDLDFVAQFGHRGLLIDLFTFSPELREAYFENEPEKLAALKGLYTPGETLSCKAQYAINKLKEIAERAKRGEKHPKRIIIFCSFKRGLTRDIADNESAQFDLERMLAEQIRKAVPEISVYSIDGGISSIPRRDGFSARDAVREAWKERGSSDDINALIAVGPSTCQGVDLAVKGHTILEICMNESMDSKMEDQIHSRTGGPAQNRIVKRLILRAVTKKGTETIDHGVSSLVEAKKLFRELVCRAAVPVAPEFLQAIEDGKPFLGTHCQPDESEEEITGDTREKVKEIDEDK